MHAIRRFEESLETLSRPTELGISLRHLERLFDRRLGTLPKRYAMELRLDRARNLFFQTEQSVAEIAMASGFTSTSHFSRTLRPKYGISPGAQRARLT